MDNRIRVSGHLVLRRQERGDRAGGESEKETGEQVVVLLSFNIILMTENFLKRDQQHESFGKRKDNLWPIICCEIHFYVNSI